MKRRPGSDIAFLLLAGGGLFLCYLVLQAWAGSQKISIRHLDGAYQTYYGLARLAAGDRVGSDFLPYLGLGPLYMLYALFALLGKNAFAAAFSALFLGALSWCLTVAGLLWLTLRGWLQPAAMWLLAMVLCLAGILLFTDHPEYFGVAYLYQPGNSLLYLRALVPFLAILGCLPLLSGRFNPVAYGIVIGIVQLWSNDYALPTVFGLYLLLGLAKLDFTRASLRTGVIVLVSHLVTWLVLLAWLTGGQPGAFLHYNFFGVMQDQFWYFAGYRRADKFFSLHDLVLIWRRGDAWLQLMLASVVPLLLVLAWAGRKWRRLDLLVLAYFGFVALASGVLSEVAGHRDARYYASLYRVWPFLVVATLLLLPGTARVLPRLPVAVATVALRVAGAGVIAALLFSGSQLFGRMDELRRSHWHYVDELGGWVPAVFQGTLAAAEEERGRLRQAEPRVRVFSEYFNPYNVLVDAGFPSRVDSVIHALGDRERDTWYSNLEALQYASVTTTLPRYSRWQNWNLFQNWRFYRHVILNYRPTRMLATLVVWEPRTEPLTVKRAAVSCSIRRQGRHSLLLEFAGIGGDPDRDLLYEVELEYAVGLEHGWLPVIGGNQLLTVATPGRMPQYFGRLFSIPHAAGSARVPLVFTDYGAGMQLTVEPAERSALTVEACRVNVVTGLDAAFYDTDWLRADSGTPFRLTDNNWRNGIARRWPGFFVRRTDRALEKFRVGPWVEFRQAGKRRITRVMAGPKYINVYVEGQLLDPIGDGHPHPIKVSDD